MAVQMQTRLQVADNSGAKLVMCIKPEGSTGKRHAGIGDIIVVSIKEAIPHAKVKKGEVYKAIIVNQPEFKRKSTGEVLRFDCSAVVLLDRKSKELIGTRISKPIPRELHKVMPKLLSLAETVV
jgi:large subunit ribosomal protein L14